jgi:hypothetical protein
VRRRVKASTFVGPILAMLALMLSTAGPAAAAGDPTRAYEQVTPVDKAGGTVDPKIGFHADPAGNGIVYKAVNVFGGSLSDGAPSIPLYASFRGADGWGKARQLSPPTMLSTSGAFFTTMAVSEDLTKALVASNRALAPGAVEGAEVGNLYIRDTHTGAYTFVGSAPPLPEFGVNSFGAFANIVPAAIRASFIAGAPDFSWVTFNGPPMLPGASNESTYRWSAAKGLQLEPWSFFFSGGIGFTNGLVSDDATKLYFQGEDGALYLREGAQTTPISVSQIEGEPATPQPAVLAPIEGVGRSGISSGDGRYVVFYTTGSTPLTSDAPGNSGDLYRYDSTTGKLTYLQINVSGSLDIKYVSDDAQTIYFPAGGELRVSYHGVISTVGPMPIGYSVSPNGRFIGIIEGPEAEPQLYLYDAATEETSCASCQLPGSPYLGGPYLFTGEINRFVHNPRPVTDNGYVVFDTAARLVPKDVNGQTDVYSFRDGVATLISPGNANFQAHAGDVSADGSDIFFVTTQSLVKQDQDGAADVYDARVGGGIPQQEEPAEPASCAGEGCQGIQAPIPGAPAIASGGFKGAGEGKRGSSSSRSSKVGVAGTKPVLGALAEVKVKVFAKGTIAVSGNGLKRTTRSVKGAGSVRVPVALSGQGRAMLKRKGRVTTTALVTFTPSTGKQSTARAKLTFKASSAGRRGR